MSCTFGVHIVVMMSLAPCFGLCSDAASEQHVNSRAWACSRLTSPCMQLRQYVRAEAESQRPPPGGGPGMLSITDDRTGMTYQVCQ
jgi:hypothetical protein